MILRLLVVMLSGSLGSQAVSALNPAWGAVLPEAAGAPLRRPRLCNRPVPWPIEGAWTPDSAVIAKLEARLARALQNALDGAPAAEAEAYLRDPILGARLLEIAEAAAGIAVGLRDRRC